MKEFKEKNPLTRRSLTVQSRRLSVIEQPIKPPVFAFEKQNFIMMKRKSKIERWLTVSTDKVICFRVT